MTKIDIEYLNQLYQSLSFDMHQELMQMIDIVKYFNDEREHGYVRKTLSGVVDNLSKGRQQKVLELIYEEIIESVRANDRRLQSPEGLTIGIWLVDMGTNPVWPKCSRTFPGRIEFAHRKTNGEIEKLEISDQRVGTSGKTIMFHRSSLAEIYYRDHCIVRNEDNFMFTADDPYGFGVLITRVWPHSVY